MQTLTPGVQDGWVSQLFVVPQPLPEPVEVQMLPCAQHLKHQVLSHVRVKSVDQTNVRECVSRPAI